MVVAHAFAHTGVLLLATMPLTGPFPAQKAQCLPGSGLGSWGGGEVALEAYAGPLFLCA